jgi:recombination protein RecT
MTDELALVKVTEYFRNDIIRSRFRDVLGNRETGAYISSVLLAVSDNPNLQECRLESIYKSALRAATLRLSVDPGTGQAYLVPLKGQATLIIGYKGLQDMAVRTGKYRYINVGPIYAGETIDEDRISGFLKIAGSKTANQVIGWIAAFEMYTGFSKTIYMTCGEIHDHARKYNPKSYNSPSSAWKTDPAKMERKTVLRQLLKKWGYLDPSDAATLDEVESEGEFIEGTIVDAEREFIIASPEPEPPAKLPVPSITLDEAWNVTVNNGTPLGTLPIEKLRIVVASATTKKTRDAAQLIISALEEQDKAIDDDREKATHGIVPEELEGRPFSYTEG